MSLLGIDYGEKRIGLAITEGNLPTPLEVVARNEARARIKKLCSELVIDRIVIGKPEGRISQAVEQFAQILRKELNIVVILWDETLSSFSAQKELIKLKKSRRKRQQNEHAVVAALILESYLEVRKP